jgi:hypothetical protein
MQSNRARHWLFVFPLGAFVAWACSSDPEPPPSGPAPTVKITAPRSGDSFHITPDEVDVPVTVVVTNFTLVALGQEGSDPSKGQIRLFVDGKDCNDPGEPPGPEHPEGEPAVPYNRILPNEKNDSTIGMDYCLGGIFLLDNKTHTVSAELWRGETKLDVSDQITIRTTFDAGDAGLDAAGDR